MPSSEKLSPKLSPNATKGVELTLGQKLKALSAGHWLLVEKVPSGGSLEARGLRSGSAGFYWRRTRDGKATRTAIGIYDPSAPPKSLSPTKRGFSIAAAFEAARELAKRDLDTPGGLRAERLRQEEALEAAASAILERSRYSLKALCSDYVEWLKKQEKSSWRDAKNIFKNHIEDAHPALAEKPARDVQRAETVSALRTLTERGKKTTARKLRAYLRAAYACAVKADSDAMLPASFVRYGVTVNPVESTAAIKGGSDKNPLSVAELRKYWRALKEEPGEIGAALRLQLLSGGQRTDQLTKLRRAQVARDTMKLFDPKGNRTEPREHVLPITKAIRSEIDLLSSGEYLLSTDGGKTRMHSTSMSAWAQRVAKRAGIDDFQLKRVRSGVETALAEMGVPLHVRGQLQSHGVGGVQERHYDAHDYLGEKRDALETLRRLLEKADAKLKRPVAK